MSPSDKTAPVKRAPSGLFQPGPGLLARVQMAQTTMHGLPVSKTEVHHLLRNDEMDDIKNKRDVKGALFLDAPFNTLSVITENLGLGGFAGFTVDNLKKSFTKPLGCIINCTYEVPMFRLEGVESLRIPISDDDQEDLAIYFDEVAEKIEEVMFKRDQVVCLHCMAGVSRSATLVMAYMMKSQKLSLEAAFREVRSRRCVARPNLNFLQQLSQYEVDLLGEEKRTPWISVTMNGVTRQVPEFIVVSCLNQYSFEFQPERSKSKKH